MAEDFGRVGAAHVAIKGDLSPLQKSLRKAEGDTRSWVGRMQAVRIDFGTMLGLGAGAGLASGLFKASKEAGNFAEQWNQAQVLFEGGADAVARDVDRMADSLKVSKVEAIQAANRLGTFALAAGQSGEQAGRFAMQMVRLADDMASFKDMSFAEAIDKISSGLAGESEPLRRVGILLSEQKVAQEAVRMGLAKTTQAVDDQAKVMARASLIQQGMAKGTGDHAKTLDSYNNQLKALEGSWSNLMTQLGEAAIPVFSKVVGWLNQIVEGASFVARNFSDIWAVAMIPVREFAENAVFSFQWVYESAVAVAAHIRDNWANIWADLANIVGTTIGNMQKNFMDFATALGAFIKSGFTGAFNFKATSLGEGAAPLQTRELKMPERQRSDLSADRDAALRRIADREDARRERLAGGMEKADLTTGGSKPAKSEKSEVLDFMEMARKIQQNILGGDSAKETAANTKSIAGDMKKAAQGIDKLAVGGVTAVAAA